MWSSGAISLNGDIDYFSIFLTAGTPYDFDFQEGSLANGYIELRN